VWPCARAQVTEAPKAPQASGPGITAADQTAQPTDTAALQDIVVTAQKRAENLQQVPIAITALGGPELAAKGVQRTTELGQIAPGLDIRATNSSFQPTLRGIGTSATFAENSTALYIDGVYIPQQVGALRDLNDIAQVAVLKGPQGTLFGRNATAGVIQITTRAPSHEFHAEAGVEVDNFETVRTDVYATGGLTSNIAVSLSAQYAKQFIGWGYNYPLNTDAGYIDHRVSVRGKLLFTPTNTTSTTMSRPSRSISRCGPRSRRCPSRGSMTSLRRPRRSRGLGKRLGSSCPIRD